ncbi:MAG TPA: hypothetical protein VNE39_02165 [Planctomycetota bacterium]|nr:hypothetical protein [Planctomycetota bacterium]
MAVSPTPELRRQRDEQERVAGTVLRFLRARARLDEMVAKGANAGGIPFAEIDAFVESQLFELKEECHWLFRSQERGEAIEASTAVLFDILVGSLFHQFMKTKENAYQVERYAPKYAALRKSLQLPDAPRQVETFLKEGERIIARSRRMFQREFAYALELFSEATIVLRHVLVENRDNPLVVRMLLDNERLLDAVYGPGSLEKLFGEMYDGSPVRGYVTAAGSLYEGGWFERARDLCKQARKLDPRNRQATHLLSKLNAAAHAHLS